MIKLIHDLLPANMRHWWRMVGSFALCTALVLPLPAGAPPGPLAGVADAGPDATLELILRDIDNNRLREALTRTENLLRTYPNFRLAYLIQGDLLLARAQPLAVFGNVPNGGANLQALRDEAAARLKGYRNRPAINQVPRYLLQMEADQKYAVVVDTQRSRLYVYRNENGRPVFVADYYASQGKAGANKRREGDNKTPVGVYHVTGHIPRAKIGDFYGVGAFPINYPNEWDRLQGRNGYGIWLHGVPSDTYARAPLSSEGCVVLANQDLTAITPYLSGRTPVIISDGVEWLNMDDWQSERAALNKSIEQWRADWASRDTTQYLRHYSKSFNNGEQNHAQWVEHKQRVGQGKSWIKVELGKLSMFRSPGQQDMVVVAFEQDYRSNNLNNVSRKRQYWLKEDGQWKIIYEGVAS